MIELEDRDVGESPPPAPEEERPHTMQAVVALFVGTVGLALTDHLMRAYKLGAERAGVLDPQPIELLQADRRVETQLQYLDTSFGADLLSRLERAVDVDEIDVLFGELESRADLYAQQPWVMYQAGFRDFGLPDQLVEFRGPDDERSCEYCRESVEGNPYPLASAPSPGAGECMSNCRHELIPLEDGELPETF